MKKPPENNPVGLRLRLLREARSMSGRELAKRIGRPQSYVSKMERGKLYPSRDYLNQVATALELNRPELELLTSLFEIYESERLSFSGNETKFSDFQRLIAQVEQNTKLIRCLDTAVIPGLLQTRRYAAALFLSFAPGSDKDAIKTAVEERLRRQLILKDRQKQFRFIFFEAVMWNSNADADTMSEQLRKLARVMNTQNVDIRCVLNGTRLPLPAMTSFQIFDGSLVLVDTFAGFVTFKSPDDIDMHVAAFDAFWQCGVSGVTLKRKLIRWSKRLKLSGEETR